MLFRKLDKIIVNLLDLFFNPKDFFKRLFFSNTLKLKDLLKDYENIKNKILQDKFNYQNDNIDYDLFLINLDNDLKMLRNKAKKEKFIFIFISFTFFLTFIYSIFKILF